MEYAIAEPHDDFVELIEYIDRQLSKPITVGEMFARKVHTLKSTDSLGRELELIRERLEMLLITENGLKDEKLGGIITPFDLLKIERKN